MHRFSISFFALLVFSIVSASDLLAEGKMISFPTPDGGEANAYLLSSKVPSSNYLFIFHERWGLDDQIKKKAQEYYNDLEGVTVIAIDLYDGVLAEDEQEADELMRGIVDSRINSIIKGAIDYADEGAEIATLGWSFGASWALKASIMMERQANGCVMYYGMPEKDIEELKKLHTTVLFFYAKSDNIVTEKHLEQFRVSMKEADRDLEIIAFEAGQAFANPNDRRFNRVAAGKSYAASLSFLRSMVRN